MKDKMNVNERSLMSNLRPANLIRVCVGVLVIYLSMAASTNLSAQAKTKEQAMAEQFRGKVLLIQAKHSGKYLDVLGANPNGGAGIGQWETDLGNNKNGSSSRFLTVEGRFTLSPRTAVCSWTLKRALTRWGKCYTVPIRKAVTAALPRTPANVVAGKGTRRLLEDQERS